MELRTTREMRRSEQLSKTMAKRAEGEAPAQARPARQQAPADKLTLSQQALAFIDEQNRKRWEWEQEREQRRQNRLYDSLSALEGASQELDAMGRELKVMETCQKIAASIMKGDNVPPKDLLYLMKNDPEGFKLAMAMRRSKEDPEECESVVEDEEEQRDGSAGGAEGGAPSAWMPRSSPSA